MNNANILPVILLVAGITTAASYYFLVKPRSEQMKENENTFTLPEKIDFNQSAKIFKSSRMSGIRPARSVNYN